MWEDPGGKKQEEKNAVTGDDMTRAECDIRLGRSVGPIHQFMQYKDMLFSLSQERWQ